MNTFGWLVKREFWEHRGGFLWTPFWISTGVLGVTLLGIIWAEVMGTRLKAEINVGIPWERISSEISNGNLAQAGAGLDVAYLMFNVLTCVALFFVLFFYLLGALYDDRKDRSVLFWKSLPVSDTATVLSKVVAATLLAPLIAFVIATAAYVVFLLLVCAWAALHGINPLPVLANTSPFGLFWRFLLTVPVDALWALPTVGWLLLCSAFARSKPFLWAVLVPVLAIIVNSWMAALGLPHINGKALISDGVLRLLISVLPGGWLSDNGMAGIGQIIGRSMSMGDRGLTSAFDPSLVWSALRSANLWIGAAAGASMIAASIWLRRKRIESSV